LGLVAKDEYGNYIIKKKIAIKGYVWIGKTLIPSFALYGFIFVGVLIAEIAVLIPHLLRFRHRGVILASNDSYGCFCYSLFSRGMAV
jgi:hypothetical protein